MQQLQQDTNPELDPPNDPDYEDEPEDDDIWEEEGDEKDEGVSDDQVAATLVWKYNQLPDTK